MGRVFDSPLTDQAPVGIRRQRNSNQPVTGQTTITWQQTNWNNGIVFGSFISGGQFWVPFGLGGLYVMTAVWANSTNGSTDKRMWFADSGGAFAHSGNLGNSYNNQCFSWSGRLNDGDSIDFFVSGTLTNFQGSVEITKVA